jgi:hypothetical protein
VTSFQNSRQKENHSKDTQTKMEYKKEEKIEGKISFDSLFDS